MREIVVNAEQMIELLKKHYFRGLKELAAAAPEIVRCRDCIYCHSTISANGYPYLFCEQWDDLPTEENSYCSYAERREDGKID